MCFLCCEIKILNGSMCRLTFIYNLFRPEDVAWFHEASIYYGNVTFYYAPAFWAVEEYRFGIVVVGVWPLFSGCTNFDLFITKFIKEFFIYGMNMAHNSSVSNHLDLSGPMLTESQTFGTSLHHDIYICSIEKLKPTNQGLILKKVIPQFFP